VSEVFMQFAERYWLVKSLIFYKGADIPTVWLESLILIIYIVFIKAWV
jgi:hypothetical protein